MINRTASGDFKHIRLAERMRLISQEWKALNEDEKEVRSAYCCLDYIRAPTDDLEQKYKALEQQDARRYVEEYSSTFGHAPMKISPGVHMDHNRIEAVAAAA